MGDEGSDSSAKIGFVIREYQGVPVHRVGEDGHILKDRVQDPLEEGMTLAIPGLFGGHGMGVVRVGQEGFWAEINEHVFATLGWCEKRGCWVSTCLVNTRGLKRLFVER